LNETAIRQGGHDNRTFREWSGWLIPVAVLAVTCALSAIFLVFYLAPTPTSLIEDHPSPTSRTDRVRLTVGGLALAIPANFLLYADARQGGERKLVELYAKFPEFEGFSEAQSQAFAGNSIDSPIIYIVIREDRFDLGEAERLRRIYLSYIVQDVQNQGPYGLTQYAFRDDSGYRNEDLFVGNGLDGPVVMRCVRFSRQVTNPSCLWELRLAKGVALSYRFKRAYLGDWQEIGAGVNKLVRSFFVPKE
jgi:hypothetical protein